MSKKVEDIFEHIVLRCNEIKGTIKRYGDDENIFLSDGDYQRPVCFNLAQIGELVKKLPMDFRNQYPQIEWKEICGLRDFVVHAYGKVDHCDIFNVIHGNVDELASFCDEWLRQNEAENESEDESQFEP